MQATERSLPTRQNLPPAGSDVHLLGVAGAGMRGLAVLLVREGFRVSGSDRDLAADMRDLAERGVRVVPEDDLGPLREARLVIHSSAIPADHPSLAAARDLGIPSLRRARALGALVNDGRLAAVSGTHGKTTVTVMLALATEAGGLQPHALAGGRIESWGGNARVGAGELAIAEADEYDKSFLELDPDLAIVTSVEPEHLECYGDYGSLRDAFVQFAAPAAQREGILTCADDPGASEVARLAGGTLSYGFSPDASFRVERLEHEPGRQSCRLHGPVTSFTFDIGVPGAHNVQNAAGALAAALILGVDPAALTGALREFRGVARRLQLLAESGTLSLFDDYAHHPTEVRASISALRDVYPSRDLAVVFQPHLFSRTRALAADFAQALAEADEVLVLPIYPAREKPLEGVTSRLIVDAAPPRVREASRSDILPWLLERPQDRTVVFMGAGDVTDLAHRAAMELRTHALGG